jgi:hypothetical protein
MEPLEIAGLVGAVCVVFIGLLSLSMYLTSRKNLQVPTHQDDNGNV